MGVFDRGDPSDKDSYEAVLEEFLGDRGRYPELGDALERTRHADIEATYSESDLPGPQAEFSQASVTS